MPEFWRRSISLLEYQLWPTYRRCWMAAFCSSPKSWQQSFYFPIALLAGTHLVLQ